MTPLHGSVLDANSPQSRAILRLFQFDLVISAVIFAVVTTLVIVAVVRFRHRPGAPEPRQLEGNRTLELIWTVIPALILIALFVGSARTMNLVDPPVGSRAPDVTIVAHQWWWEYRYAPSGVRAANELHLPLDRRCLLDIRSADVIHDFWVPGLGAKMDAVPGRTNHLWLTPERAGTFLGTCAEFCGNQHALMGIRVVVEPPAAFAAWERSQLEVPSAPVAGAAAEGERLFQTRTCSNCHTIAGTPAVGTVGPDLTHLAGRATLAAGTLPNTPADLARWIQHPERYKPGCLMPDLHLTGGEARAITSYLEGLR